MDNESRKLMAIMFTDIHGYSRMMQIDEKLTIEMLEEHNKLLFPIISNNGGRIIKTVGDAILAVFESCISAVKASVQIQESLSKKAASEPDKHILRVRIGIHLGETLIKDNDVFGNGVNIAARLQPLADPGGICFSQSVYEQLHNHYGERIVRVGPVNLKNISEPVVIYRMQIEGDSAVNIDLNKQRAEFKTAFNEGVKPLTTTEEDKTITATFAQNILNGSWKSGGKLQTKVRFGELIIDLRNAEFPSNELLINVDVLMGGMFLIINPNNMFIDNCVSYSFGAISGIKNNLSETKKIDIKLTGKVIFGEISIKENYNYQN